MTLIAIEFLEQNKTNRMALSTQRSLVHVRQTCLNCIRYGAYHILLTVDNMLWSISECYMTDISMLCL